MKRPYLGVQMGPARRPQDGYGCVVSIRGYAIGAAEGKSAEEALSKASELASEMAAVLKEHPELKALLPPQTVVAIEAIRVASKLAKEGRLDEAAARAGKAAVKTVKSILSSVF